MDSRPAAAIEIEELPTCKLLRDVDPSTLNRLLRASSTIDVEPGALVIDPESEHHHAFLILAGKLSVHSSSSTGEPIAFAQPGDLIGELSILNHGKHSATVVAALASRLLVFDELAFWDLVNHSHAFAVNLLRHLAERLRQNNDSAARNVDLRSKFEREANFDAMTGLRNRRWFDHALDRVIERARGREPLCLMILDIDFFKAVNDTHGHPAGDSILVAIAHALTAHVRPTDLLARVGGEEFAIILPGASAESATRAAERFRTAIAQTSTTMPNGQQIKVTVSIGIAELQAVDSVSTLYAAADTALYQAKQAGRNRVEFLRR